MLATRSQPLMHTEYLQPLDPLPTTLDAKKSPLALLAQTCSSIGKPDPPPPSNDIKPALTPIDAPNGKISPVTRNTSCFDKPSFKPYKQIESVDGDATVTKIGYPHPPKTASPQTGFPPRPASREHIKSTSAPASPVAAVKPKTESIPPIARTPPTGSPASQTSHCGDHRNISSVPKHSAPLPAQTAPHVVSSFPSLSASYKGQSGHCGCSSSQVSGHIPYLSDHYHAHKHDSNHVVAASAQSPYAAAYARVKTADGGTTLMPICRDPYCNNCQSAQLAAAASSCTQSSGCTQCRHDNVAFNGAFPVALPVAGALPYLPTSLASAIPTSPYLYSHAALPASAQNEHGHVCNWVSGSTSCGKRFASSEELLQHLRTHTMSSSEVSNASALSATLNAQLSAYYMQYPAAAAAAMASPLGFAKSPFQSALSPGAAAAIRYHPYKSSVPSQITALPGLPAGYYPYPLHDLKTRFPTGVPH